MDKSDKQTAAAARKVRNDQKSDRETIVAEAAHIPDRDQVFHDPRRRSPASLAEALRIAWSGDIETQVEGARNFQIDADQELLGVMPAASPDRPVAHHTASRPRVADASRVVEPPKGGAARLVASDLAQISRLLVERRHDLELVLASQATYLREQLAPADADTGAIDFNHPADEVSADPDYERELRLMAQERHELEQINQALARLAEGRFGTCECGESIPAARLFAVPYTTHCLRCQEGVEQSSPL